MAVVVSTALATFWAFWGGAENFHEGWYHRELWRNVALMVIQYLPWMFLPMAAALLALWRWPAGLAAHFLLAAAVFALVGVRSAGGLYLGVPIVLIGLLHAWGRPTPRWLASRALLIIPCTAFVAAGAFGGWRALTRPATVDETTRVIAGNQVRLVWAGRGPGWGEGRSWFDARDRCAHLTADAGGLDESPQGIWRLPTVDEAMRSMAYRGRNAGGTWDARPERATFRVLPDKEAPLWDPFSPVVYLWTADESAGQRAYFVSFEGRAFTRPKRASPQYQGYRCVKPY